MSSNEKDAAAEGEQAPETPCGIRDAQRGQTCVPFDDPRAHDFQGWIEFDEGRGGTQVCTRCGISAFSHAIRYGP